MNAVGRHLVGILGGMGPAATADFYTQLIRMTPADHDQEHLSVVIWADPTVPDRIASVLGHGVDAYPSMLAGARKLRDLGVAIAVMPCHTAHYYLDRLAADSGLRFIDMVAETVSVVTSPQSPPATVGMLATRATLLTRLYQDRFAAAGVRTVDPPDATQQAVDRAIQLVKAGEMSSAQAPAEFAVRSLADAGADVVVLACTELPVALRDGDCDSLPTLVDPTEVLARAVIRECQGERSASR